MLAQDDQLRTDVGTLETSAHKLSGQFSDVQERVAVIDAWLDLGIPFGIGLLVEVSEEAVVGRWHQVLRLGAGVRFWLFQEVLLISQWLRLFSFNRFLDQCPNCGAYAVFPDRDGAPT